MLFGGKKAQHDPMEAFVRGSFFCDKCGKMVSLQGYTPLEVGKCIYCSEVNFIPMKVADFWLFEPLGGGGMGAVYKACRESQPGELFAVKVLPRAKKANPQLIENLEMEERIACAIAGHDAMVNPVDWGCVDGEYYMAMEFVDGERLDKKIDRLGKLPEGEIIHIGLRLLSALAHIYNCGYLFRDMKPQNVIINQVYGAYLLDYGICMEVHKALHDDSDMIQGSPMYMPPERLLGEPETAASEIYSLGLLMFHAVTGQPYFTGNDVETLVKHHMTTARMKNIGNRMKDISSDLAYVMDRMIKRDAADRYQSYHDVEAALLKVYLGRRAQQARR